VSGRCLRRRQDGDDAGVFDTVSKAGAGLLDVYSAIHATTLVSPGELVLNDTANFKGSFPFGGFFVWYLRVTPGDSPKRYTLKHVPARIALTMKDVRRSTIKISFLMIF